MEPLNKPFEKLEVALLKADSLSALQEQIDLFTNDKGQDTIYRTIVRTTLNSSYDEDKKCMVHYACILYKFISPDQLFAMFSR